MTRIKRQTLFRALIYTAGLLMLTVGVTLSTKTGLGVYPPESIPYALSIVFGWKFSNMVLVMYAVYVGLQFIIKGKHHQWKDLLQIPVSLAFSALLGWLGPLIPLHFELLWQNIAMMAVSVLFTGFGFALMVNMDVVPNPPDGLTYAVSEALGKDLGFVKNIQDIVCVAAAAAIDLLTRGTLASVGIGTVMAVLLIGRMVALVNRTLREKLRALAGLA